MRERERELFSAKRKNNKDIYTLYFTGKITKTYLKITKTYTNTYLKITKTYTLYFAGKTTYH
jgi:hypothetical protein